MNNNNANSNACCQGENTTQQQHQDRETQNAPVTRAQNRRVFVPPVDIVDAGNEVTLTLDMPGANPDGISVDLEQGTLTIHGKVEPRGGACYVRREYGVGDYHREFTVSDQIDNSGVTAEYKAGVLTVRLPKAAKAVTRRVAVQSA